MYAGENTALAETHYQHCQLGLVELLVYRARGKARSYACNCESQTIKISSNKTIIDVSTFIHDHLPGKARQGNARKGMAVVIEQFQFNTEMEKEMDATLIRFSILNKKLLYNKAKHLEFYRAFGDGPKATHTSA